MSRLLPRETDRADAPYNPNPRGTRIFRVTDRTIDQRTRLVIATSPEEAITDDASEISGLAREQIHEVVECVEYMAQGMTWHAPPEVTS